MRLVVALELLARDLAARALQVPAGLALNIVQCSEKVFSVRCSDQRSDLNARLNAQPYG